MTDLLPEGLTTATLLLVLLAALTAGFVDAVVGGGGLIQLPALLLVPGITPVQALATNKLGSVFGTSTSAVTYYRRVRDRKSTRLNSSHANISYAVFCLKKKNKRKRLTKLTR